MARVCLKRERLPSNVLIRKALGSAFRHALAPRRRATPDRVLASSVDRRVGLLVGRVVINSDPGLQRRDLSNMATCDPDRVSHFHGLRYTPSG